MTTRFQKTQDRFPVYMLMAIALCALLCNTLGCAYMDQAVPGKTDANHRYDAEEITLERGNQAFQNSDYQKALEIYRTLSQLARNEDVRRKSLYGLACTRLMLAESPDELSESIVLWDVWRQLEPKQKKNIEQALLRPLLMQKELPEKNPEQPDDSESISDANTALEKTIADKNTEIVRLKSKIKNMEKEIKKLKHQLLTLEAIDQNIKQKMTEIE